MVVSGHRHSLAVLYPMERWPSELVWTQRLEEKFIASDGDRSPAVQYVVRHCTDRHRSLFILLYVTLAVHKALLSKQTVFIREEHSIVCV
jgi:hypothetical protein